ncbi:hypothetical protein ABMA27_014216 [Loxostege sticticalis]|uniref:Uncharacterized protein n=1 Tax=Loxostege sticticalis TaxID=481309 RepID=A0ABR3ID49_LOXSC
MSCSSRHLRVIWPGGRTLSRSQRAILSGTLVHRHSCVRRHDPASSRSTSTGAYGTPPAPGGRAGGSSGSAAPNIYNQPVPISYKLRSISMNDSCSKFKSHYCPLKSLVEKRATLLPLKEEQNDTFRIEGMK